MVPMLVPRYSDDSHRTIMSQRLHLRQHSHCASAALSLPQRAAPSLQAAQTLPAKGPSSRSLIKQVVALLNLKTCGLLQWPQRTPYLLVPVVARALTMPLVTRHPRMVRP